MPSMYERPPPEPQDAVTQNKNPDLSQSFKNLSLSTSPAVQQATAPCDHGALSPHSASLPLTSPSTARVRPSPRSPANRQPRSRSSTPTLLRKASTSSLWSANGRAPSQPPSRRSSLVAASSPTPKSPFASAISEHTSRSVPTPSSVASDYFKAELEIHHGADSTTPADVAVILHDACYGHRYSRPKTSRAALSTIVERPERIRASALGVAMAYVRLGQRHCGGSYAIHPKLDPGTVPIPFRILKTARRLPLMSPVVTNVHGAKWMEELRIMSTSAENKLAMGGKELQRPEMNRGSDQGAPAKFHEGDLYLCAESLDALEGALGAVCEAVDRVFTTGPRRAFVAIRPPGHHCSASFPSGFCWINNVHVGIMHAILHHGLTHAAIIDFDLHHGDGSQAIAWQQNARASAASKNSAAWKKASIGYFSIHDINSYPCEAGDEDKVKNASLCIENAHGQTIWNVHLQSWVTEAEFWDMYETRYAVLLDKARVYLRQQAIRLRAAQQHPKAAIFFSAGFDASEWEMKGMQRHNVNVPTGFYARITQDVVKMAAEEGLEVGGRVISVLEGGYSDRALSSGVLSHISGLVGGEQPKAAEAQTHGSLMGQKVTTAEDGQLGIQAIASHNSLQFYDSSWWSSTALDDLEAGTGDVMESRKSRRSTPSTYSSPTQASTAKIVQPMKKPRSISGLSFLNDMVSRPPTPPPPDVPWITAVHELSNLLIPSDRQTESCKAEDLNAEATRARRNKQSLLNPPVPPPEPVAPRFTTSRMSLRERKPTRHAADERRPIVAADAERDKTRRKTVVGSPVLGSGSATAGTVSGFSGPGQGKRAVRRLSATSSNSSIIPGSSRGPAGAAREQQPGGTSLRRGSAPAKDAAIPKSNATDVRKTKVPATSRGGTARALRGSKKTAAAANGPTLEPPRVSASSGDEPPTGQIHHSTDDGVEQITTGMKKIRINLITQSQKEDRARAARAIAAKTKSAKYESLNHQPGVATVSPEMQAVSPFQQSNAPLSPKPLPVQTTVHPDMSTPVPGQAQMVPSPTSLPVLEIDSTGPVSERAVPAISGTSVDHCQAVEPTPSQAPQRDDYRLLPPNKSTLTAVKGNDLPVFTSTSNIRFDPPQTYGSWEEDSEAKFKP
ncbi:Arginase/deacetylase [Sodiomyces alkalinus F11]|uniref:Arginase/deacetylase n=1 Tax=Sodiomyces alkalinus (strain CBS 110278 / VKM F-3762 / F11) TaxID=1314773 RepID=A0A3N2PY59_SODAK|nr:Arginase/deacetylase [Sodiomyces alkalinus F11]ROT39463.1 Arginase/deacetylase [Sodiomyces alkalinus F11]